MRTPVEVFVIVAADVEGSDRRCDGLQLGDYGETSFRQREFTGGDEGWRKRARNGVGLASPSKAQRKARWERWKERGGTSPFPLENELSTISRVLRPAKVDQLWS